jgi:hypothetical protein
MRTRGVAARRGRWRLARGGRRPVSPRDAGLSAEQLSKAANNPNVPRTQLRLRNSLAPSVARI